MGDGAGGRRRGGDGRHPLMPLDDALALQLQRYGFARTHGLVWMTGLTRQTVARQLRRWLDAGALVRSGRARAVRYHPPPPEPRLSACEGPRDFWRRLTAECDGLVYVPVAAWARRLDRADAGRQLFDRWSWARFAVLDFAGVARASDLFLAELLGAPGATTCTCLLLNLVPALRASLDRGVRHLRRKEDLYLDWG